MLQSSKLILLVAGGFVGLLILAVAIVALILRANAKPRLTAAASQALGMEVNVGEVDIHYFPSLHVALGDAHIRNRGVEVAAAMEVDLGIELLPLLLRREVRVKSLTLKQASVSIERDRSGKLNLAGAESAAAQKPVLNLAKLSISDGRFVYADKQSGSRLEAATCTLEMSNLQFSSAQSADFPKGLSLAGQLECGEIRTQDFTASDLKLSVAGKNGVVALDPVTMRLFGGAGSGSVRVDLSGTIPVYAVRYRLAQLRIEQFFNSLSPKQAGEGAMDFTTTLSLRGKNTDELKGSVMGEASLHGETLKFQIGDIDKKYSRYESSQNFNLVDVGAFFFVGPLGLGVTKGYDFARIFDSSGASTEVSRLVSIWEVEHGVAYAKDVAMATRKNRLALQGGLDFRSGRFKDVTVALVDARGCAQVQQKIRGPFRAPQVDQPSVLAAITGPTRQLFKKLGTVLGDKCAVFYAGSVTAPG